MPGHLRGRVPLYVAVSAAALIFIASLAVLNAERGAPNANIQTIRTALWWACVTVTTVGYGDHYPVTTEVTQELSTVRKQNEQREERIASR